MLGGGSEDQLTALGRCTVASPLLSPGPRGVAGQGHLIAPGLTLVSL